jgi:hypothetical protein
LRLTSTATLQPSVMLLPGVLINMRGCCTWQLVP